jgi:hypothetical protein
VGVPTFPAAQAGTVVTEAPLGTYRVVLSVGGRSFEKSVQVLADPGR